MRHLAVDQLAAPVLRAVLDDAGFGDAGFGDTGLGDTGLGDTGLGDTGLGDAAEGAVDDVLLGNVLGPGGNPARVAALRAGLDYRIPGMTLDRQCASGLSAITTAAAMLRAGVGDWYLAGGVESASTAPWRAWRPRSTTEPPRFYTRAPFAPAEIGDPEMGAAADVVAAEAGVSRERQDRFAARSHARAVAARAEHRFAHELVETGGVNTDERPRERFTPERLARFRPAFTPDGTATAANSCGISDAAAAVLITTETNRRRLGLDGIRLVDWHTAGVDPNRLGLGAVPAMRTVLRRRRTPVDTVEFNEAFAGQTLACLDAVGIDEHNAGPDGGAIALGHPWGASGAVLVVRLFSSIVRGDGPRTGLAALSSGGGLGVATVWERVG
ncbi:thiolase family protein [Parasphingorhabdus pacifica]